MRRGITVLMTADTTGTGLTYACGLADALRPHGVTIALATMGAPLRVAQARALAGLPNVEVFETSFAVESMTDPWIDVDAASDWLLAIAALVRPHVVHLDGVVHAALPFDAPVVAVAHAVRRWEAGADWCEYRHRALAGLHAAAAIVSTTAAGVRDLMTTLGADLPARVIPNGRTIDVPEVPRESFVLAIGGSPDAGLETLDASAHSLAWPIQVVDDLDSQELVRWTSRAPIFAYPARIARGFTILDAALSGCALVLSDLPALREIWGNAATFIAPGDPALLTRALDTLIRDPLRRAAFGHRARERARTVTPARMAAAYHALYMQLAERVRKAVA